MKTAAIIVAAGRGQRADTGLGAKQYTALDGRTMLAWSLAKFIAHDEVGDVIVVIHPDDRQRYEQASSGFNSDKLQTPVVGGGTRQASVLAGLRTAEALGPDVVLIHDAARPFVSSEDISNVLGALREHDGAVPGLPVVDTVKSACDVPAGGPKLIDRTVDRSGLWQAQTPQGFRFDKILAAHEHAARDNSHDFTDDASIAEFAGLDVVLVEGSACNFKITTPADLARAKREVDRMAPEYRTGTGFDVHAFTRGDHVWLCGVKVAHDAALAGHSDADVAMHALTDAIFGALADGDIGAHFPPSDPQWRGARSEIFLAAARERVAALGGQIVHVDVTIICEGPKIGPHRAAMRARLGEILRLPVDRVSVKATTTEGLGFAGRREGMAAQANATIRLQAGSAEA